MTQAQHAVRRYQDDATALLLMLDDMGLETDQDWENGTTTFIFPDDSRVTIGGIGTDTIIG